MGLIKEKLLLLTASAASASTERAKSVFLFIGDAAGIPTLNVESIYVHDGPQARFFQQMSHLKIRMAAYGRTDSKESRP